MALATGLITMGTGALAQKDGTWITEPVAIHDLTLEELRTYQVGELNPDSDYARKWPEQIPVMGARVPTLDEVLACSSVRKSSSTVWGRKAFRQSGRSNAIRTVRSSRERW